MFKVLLKHFIYEKCIDVIFDNIVNNFSEISDEMELKCERAYIYLKNRNKFNRVSIIGKAMLLTLTDTDINMPTAIRYINKINGFYDGSVGWYRKKKHYQNAI